ncbi:MAG: hypothetical protein ACP5QB_10140 [Thiomonas sp.]
MKKALLIAIACAALLWAVDVAGNLNITGTLTAAIVDFTSAQSTAPMKSGTTLPGTCSVGQAFFKTDATAGQNIYLCTSANTWTQVQGGSGGGTFDWKPNSRYSWFQTDFPAYYNQGSPANFGDVILGRNVGSTNLNNPNPTMDSAHPGIANISTTTTSGNRTSWSALLGGPAPNDTTSLFALSNTPWEFRVVFRLPNTTDYANSSFWIGMMSNTSETPPRGVVIRYLAGTDTNFMFAYASQNAWDSTVSTGVAPDTNWHTFTIRSDGSTANKIWLRFDNGTEISGCPSGCDLTVATYQSSAWSGIFTVNITTNEAAAKYVYVDYVHLWRDLGAVR